MKELTGACVVAQSGGPTAVINASILGVIKASMKSELITEVYGASHGVLGIIAGELFDMRKENPDELELLMHTPSAVLGSCRYRLADPSLDDTDYKAILDTFNKYNIRYFFYCGDNNSMDACLKIDGYLAAQGYACRVVGIPKTIDNNLKLTDHCPGYGSAAKYIATTMMELRRDATVYDTGMITVVEIMGGNAGWLTAAASLAAVAGEGPDLIYMPEVPFDLHRFIDDVMAVYQKTGKVLVAVSEGIRDKAGVYVARYAEKNTPADASCPAQMGGVAAYLAGVLKEKTGAKVRGIELSLLQRCAAHLASARDIKEAYDMGKSAVRIALIGVSGVMVTINRVDNSDYHTQFMFEPLKKVAGHEKKFPRDWINESGNGIHSEFVEYCLPLIEGEVPGISDLPRYARLKYAKA